MFGCAGPSPFTVADTLAAYLASPVGNCLLGPTYAVFWHSAELNGLVFWDRPEEEHIQRVTRALDAELAPSVAPHGSLIDARRVQAVDLGAFNTLFQYVNGRRETFSRLVRRQALVRPEGLAGAAVAGFYAVLAPSYPVNVFTEPEAALAWLGIADAERVASEIDAVYASATSSPSIVVALRAYLEQRLGTSNLEEAARALDMSTRQLQRRLLDARTSFQREERTARIRAATTLLLETNYDIKRVALEVGFASLQHFGAFFRKVTHETPSQWRARHRK
jgi:AraC-like DNA-binding protein